MMEHLPHFDESSLNRVLCVAAHPDDLEYGASAAVARWTAADVSVSYLLLTAGEAGMRSRPPEEAGPLRAREQRKACAAVGVEDLLILDLPDGLLEADHMTRRHIARRIRAVQPDLVLTQPWDLEVGWGLNHVDHRAAGLAVVDAIRDADNPWIFPELIRDENLHPWSAHWLMVAGAEPDHLIDVTGAPIRQAVSSLSAHVSYLEELSDHPDPEEMLSGMTSEMARRSADPAVHHALGVRLFPM